MRNIKITVLGLLGATFLTTGLYSCSNDDATLTDNVTTEQAAMAAKGISDMIFIPGFPDLGFVSSYAGPCVPASGFCLDYTTWSWDTTTT